jgi:hypothetical protein
LSIRIPNSEFVVPDFTINSDGTVVGNDSVREIVINSLQDTNTDNMPIVGRQFFSSAYLLVNQDDLSYTLWEANPTTDTDIIPINSQPLCGNGTTNNSTATTPSSTSVSSTAHPSTSSTSSPLASPKHELSTGVIVGIIVGACAALAISGLALFLWLRRKDGKSLPALPVPSYEPKSYYSDIKTPKNHLELDSKTRQSLLELDSRRSVLELHGKALPVEAEAQPSPVELA